MSENGKVISFKTKLCEQLLKKIKVKKAAWGDMAIWRSEWALCLIFDPNPELDEETIKANFKMISAVKIEQYHWGELMLEEVQIRANGQILVTFYSDHMSAKLQGRKITFHRPTVNFIIKDRKNTYSPPVDYCSRSYA